MGLTRARVIKEAELAQHRVASVRDGKHASTLQGLPVARRIHRDEFAARERAAQVTADALRRAEEVVQEAQRQAADTCLREYERARADAMATVAAQAVKLQLAERQAAERHLEQSIQMARLLAERLIGAELSLHPHRIVELANQALQEARAARSLEIHGHPEDLQMLRSVIDSEEQALSFVPDTQLKRGDLVVITELGELDARLEPQLDRLVGKLREVLRSDEAQD